MALQIRPTRRSRRESTPAPDLAQLLAQLPELQKPGVLQRLLGGLASVGEAIDVPASYLRGALALKPGEKASGKELVAAWKGGRPEDVPWQEWLAAEMIFDPINALGIGLLSKAGKATKGLGAAKAALKAAQTAKKPRRVAEAVKRIAELEKVAAGPGPKRALLSLDVPFVKSLQRIPLLEGKPVLAGGAKLGQAIGKVPGVAPAGKGLRRIFSTGLGSTDVAANELMKALKVEAGGVLETGTRQAVRRQKALQNMTARLATKYGKSPKEIQEMIATATELAPVPEAVTGTMREGFAKQRAKYGQVAPRLPKLGELGGLVKGRAFVPTAKQAKHLSQPDLDLLAQYASRAEEYQAFPRFERARAKLIAKTKPLRERRATALAHLAQLPPEVKKIGKGVRRIGEQDDYWMDMAEGVVYEKLRDKYGLGYMHRMLTPAGKEWTRALKGKVDHPFHVLAREIQPKKGYQLARQPALGGKSIPELNTWAKELGFEGDELFHVDPAVTVARRTIQGAQARGDALILRGVAEHLSVSGKLENGVPMATFLERAGIKPTMFGRIDLKAKIPGEIVEDVLRLREVLRDPQELRGVMQVVDKVNNMYRVGVTAFFPGYHMRNLTSNVVLNWLGGVYDPRWYAKAWRIVQKNADPKMLREMQQYGVLDAGQMGGEIAGMAKRGFAGVESASRLPRRFGTAIENNARAAHYLAKRAEGLTAGEAALSVKKYLFDYGDLTQIEKRYFRRWAFFWTFMRNNIPLQIETMLTQPRKQMALYRMARGGEPGEKTELPPWRRPTSPFRLPFMDKPGKKTFLSLGLPHEDIGMFSPEGRKGVPAAQRISQKMLGLLAPVPRVPLELIVGKEFRTGREFNAIGTVGPMYSKLPSPVRKLIGLNKQTTKAGKTYYTVAPWFRTVMRSILPTSRVFSTAEILTRPDRSLGAKLLQVVMGARLDEIDLSDAERKRTYELRDRLFEELVGKGELRPSARHYPLVPKGTPERLDLNRLLGAK